jgi:large subunit ribosomal protein L34e
MPDHRVTLTRRHAYRTVSNRVKTVVTPGGRHACHYTVKSRNGVLCGDAGCNIVLPGIKHMSRSGFKKAHSKDKTVSRAYGGSRCGNCVRQRIVRAFLIEEQKIVKKVLAEKLKKKGDATA